MLPAPKLAVPSVPKPSQSLHRSPRPFIPTYTDSTKHDTSQDNKTNQYRPVVPPGVEKSNTLPPPSQSVTEMQKLSPPSKPVFETKKLSPTQQALLEEENENSSRAQGSSQVQSRSFRFLQNLMDSGEGI